MGMSTYLSGALLSGTFRNIAYVPAVQTYLALFTSDAGLRDNNSGLWTEIAGGAYARQAVVFTDPLATKQIQNSADVNFPKATAVWGNVTHGAMMDQLAAPGNVLTWGPLTIARNIQIGDELDFLAGSIVIPWDKD